MIALLLFIFVSSVISILYNKVRSEIVFLIAFVFIIYTVFYTAAVTDYAKDSIQKEAVQRGYARYNNKMEYEWLPNSCVKVEELNK